MDGDWEEVSSLSAPLLNTLLNPPRTTSSLGMGFGPHKKIKGINHILIYECLHSRSGVCSFHPPRHRPAHRPLPPLHLITLKSSSGSAMDMDASRVFTALTWPAIHPSRLVMGTFVNYFSTTKESLPYARGACIWQCGEDLQYGTLRMVLRSSAMRPRLTSDCFFTVTTI